MSVINTEEWLKEHGNQPIKMCEKLSTYFNGNSARDIYEYLCLFGMYKSSVFTRNNKIDLFVEQNYWDIVKKEYEVLREKWKGPNIPIIIFPVNEAKVEIMKENKGKSGIAFTDKLILFLATDIEKSEIKALLTHEYNHVCRLMNMSKKEEDVTLLDTIILEGLAEHAVKEHCGSDLVAYWTKLYSNKELQKWWKKLVYPNRNKSKNEKEYQEILYGLKAYPKMLGYSLGYHIIETCLFDGKKKLREIEVKKSEEILKLYTRLIRE